MKKIVFGSMVILLALVAGWLFLQHKRRASRYQLAVGHPWEAHQSYPVPCRPSPSGKTSHLPVLMDATSSVGPTL